MLSNIIKSKKQNVFNCYDWQNLTLGKLMVIHSLAKENINQSICHDICHEIENFAFENPEFAQNIENHKH